MFLTIEFEPEIEPDDEKVLARFRPGAAPDSGPDSGRVLSSHGTEFEAWSSRATGRNHIRGWRRRCRGSSAKEYIETVLSSLPPALGAGGHVRSGQRRPDLRGAAASCIPGRAGTGLGDLGRRSAREARRAVGQLDMASELSIGYGGKRYLSGFITFDTPERWAAHYGRPVAASVCRQAPLGPERHSRSRFHSVRMTQRRGSRR